jgi:phosphate uptake regulator
LARSWHDRGAAHDFVLCRADFLDKSLELILEHSKNIAELVVYVVQGADVRHTPVEQIESVIG